MLVMSMSAGQLLILTLQLDFNPLCKFSSSTRGGTSGRVRSKRMEKAPREQGNNEGTPWRRPEGRESPETQRNPTATSNAKMLQDAWNCILDIELHTDYMSWCGQLSEELSYVQREEPTALWGNHKSINQQTTRLGSLVCVYVFSFWPWLRCVFRRVSFSLYVGVTPTNA